MQALTFDLEGRGAGTTHHLTSFSFGDPSARPRLYVQGGLHADEGPGMIAARMLCDRLEALEAEGRLTGHVCVVPVANPIGLSQFALGQQEGRFDNYDGKNFNRFYPDLGSGAARRVAGSLTADTVSNVETIRQALRAELTDWRASTPADRLRKVLMSLAIDADYVLDLHCDGEAEVHLYTQPAFAQVFAPLSAHLGARAVLLAEISGENPFDEAVARPWIDIARAFPDVPIPLSCASSTVELRGRRDVDRGVGERDAAAIVRFLVHLGFMDDDVDPLPVPLCEATPLAGSEALIAPRAGLLAFIRDLGEVVLADEIVAEIVDPLSGAVTPVKATTNGVFYARADTRIAEMGKRIGKIAGKQPYRDGLLLSP